MKLRYKHKITLDKTSRETYRIITDLGDEYETAWTVNSNTPWTDWWDKQARSELRDWQKEIMRTLAATVFEDLRPLTVYKQGHGYSQPHDIGLAHSQQHSVWVLLTERNTWITINAYANFTVETSSALGSVNDKTVRDQIWELLA